MSLWDGFIWCDFCGQATPYASYKQNVALRFAVEGRQRDWYLHACPECRRAWELDTSHWDTDCLTVPGQ